MESTINNDTTAGRTASIRRGAVSAIKGFFVLAMLAGGLTWLRTDEVVWREADECHRKGMAALFGLDGPKNRKEAARWFRKAAERGHPVAPGDLGGLCAKEGDIDGATRWFRKASEPCDAGTLARIVAQAERGNVRAQCLLGMMHAEGSGVPGNAREAEKWLGKAAERGDVFAQFSLAWMYMEGKSVLSNALDRDDGKAAEWMRKAAERGLSEAQVLFGVFCQEGRGVPRNCEEAVAWYRKAAAKGHAEAMYNLCLCFENGHGVERDERKAAAWCRKAAERGCREAKLALQKHQE
jgi:hypothetical protein